MPDSKTQSALSDIERVLMEMCDEWSRESATSWADILDDRSRWNWSLQWLPGEARPRLSPCYDLVATVAWPEFGWGKDPEPELALPFARSKRLADLDGARVRLFVRQAGAPDGEERFMAALDRAKQAWLAREAEAPPRMRTALVEHWARVPVLQALGGLAAEPSARA